MPIPPKPRQPAYFRRSQPRILLPFLAAACVLPVSAVYADTPADTSGAPVILPPAPTLRLPRVSVFGLDWPASGEEGRKEGGKEYSPASPFLMSTSGRLPFSLFPESDEEQVLPLDDTPDVSVVPVRSPAAASVAAYSDSQNLLAPPLTRRGSIAWDSTAHFRFNSDTGLFEFRDGVRIVYTDPRTNAETTLNAESAEYNARTGLLTAHKGARLERTEGSFVGEEITYNLITRAGFVTNAIAETDYFRMRGSRIEALADGSYVVEDGVFTTCIRGRPDYQIRARRLTIRPDQYVSANHVTFYAGPTALLTVPSYKRNLNTRSSVSTPLPGYNKNDGILVRLHDTPILETRRSLEYDANLNLRRTPTGYVGYEFDLSHSAPKAPPPRGLRTALSDPLHGTLEQLTPPTYREYAEDRYEDEFVPRATAGVALQNQQYVYNRRRTDLNVSRYPEFNVRFINLLGRASDANTLQTANQNAPRDRDGAPGGPMGAAINPLLQRISSAPFLLDLNVSLGEISENPTRVSSGRLAFQTSAATQPLLIGKRISLRFAVTDWLNAYTKGGSAYNLFSPETELDYLPTRTTRFGIGYRFSDDIGRTPFVFDRLDVRHEMRLLFQTGGPVAFGYEAKFDMERTRQYDGEFAVLRNLDCMQVGIAYRQRTQSFGVIFHLLPPDRNRAARRAQPLQAIPGNRPSG